MSRMKKQYERKCCKCGYVHVPPWNSAFRIKYAKEQELHRHETTYGVDFAVGLKEVIRVTCPECSYSWCEEPLEYENKPLWKEAPKGDLETANKLVEELSYMLFAINNTKLVQGYEGAYFESKTDDACVLEDDIRENITISGFKIEELQELWKRVEEYLDGLQTKID